MTQDNISRLKEICPHCKQEGIILYAVNFKQKACWDCIVTGKVENPAGLGWSK